jgi:CHAT domain-containing protein
LRGKKLVGIIPDGPLWNLPFQALVEPSGRHLMEDHALFYAPSLTTLFKTLRLNNPNRERLQSLLAIGAPDFAAMNLKLAPLPLAAEEVQAVGKLYGKASSTVFTGNEADESTWKAAAPHSRILHLATHGALNSTNPFYSYLVLGARPNSQDDGLLEAREVLDLDLHADLVVLSACDTARGSFSYGEGLLGMSWAFLVAGAPTTVVSQWKVEAASTHKFMTEFHRALLAKQTASLSDKAQALQHAALTVMRMESFRHPFYWAPFVMIGNGY